MSLINTDKYKCTYTQITYIYVITLQAQVHFLHTPIMGNKWISQQVTLESYF